MENWEVIKVECIETFDPKIVRVTVNVLGIPYSIDIPSPIYPDISAPLGWPTNPCNQD